MTWWRNLGGLLAACVLALLVVAPSMASCVCDGVTSTVSAATVQAVQSDHRDDGAACEAACCVSGHCHHGEAMLDTPVAPVPAPTPVLAEHATASADAPASRTISGPDRPPRL
jgi:hypothetical protein